jgi:hypothetical protein
MPSTRRNIMSDLPTAVPFDAPTFALSDHFSRLPPRGGVYLKRVATESVVRELLHELGFACKNFKYVLESGQYDSLSKSVSGYHHHIVGRAEGSPG